MKIYAKYLLGSFLKFFFIIWIILSLFISIIDLLSSFINFLSYGLTTLQILKAFIYHIPTITVFSMPFAALFSSAYLFGRMNNDGELLGFMTLGYSMLYLVVPQFIFSFVLAFGSFVLAETISITTMNKRYEILSHIKRQDEPSYVVFKGDSSIFYAEKYIEEESQFQDVVIIIFDEEKQFIRRVDANYASWNGEHWQMDSVRILNTDNKTEALHIPQMVWEGQPSLDEIKFSLRKGRQDLNLKEARQQIEILKKNGMPYRMEMLNFLRRFSKPFTVLVYTISPLVLILQRGRGVLYSGMAHFSIAGAFTILNMIFGIDARNGSLNTAYASWMPLFWTGASILWIYLFRKYREIYLKRLIKALPRLIQRLSCK